MLYTNKASLKLSPIEKQMHFELGRILHQENLKKRKPQDGNSRMKKIHCLRKEFFCIFLQFSIYNWSLRAFFISAAGQSGIKDK